VAAPDNGVVTIDARINATVPIDADVLIKVTPQSALQLGQHHAPANHTQETEIITWSLRVLALHYVLRPPEWNLYPAVLFIS